MRSASSSPLSPKASRSIGVILGQDKEYKWRKCEGYGAAEGDWWEIDVKDLELADMIEGAIRISIEIDGGMFSVEALDGSERRKGEPVKFSIPMVNLASLRSKLKLVNKELSK